MYQAISVSVKRVYTDDKLFWLLFTLIKNDLAPVSKARAISPVYRYITFQKVKSLIPLEPTLLTVNFTYIGGRTMYLLSNIDNIVE